MHAAMSGEQHGGFVSVTRGLAPFSRRSFTMSGLSLKRAALIRMVWPARNMLAAVVPFLGGLIGASTSTSGCSRICATRSTRWAITAKRSGDSPDLASSTIVVKRSSLSHSSRGSDSV
eukprot:scaffold91959_cov55-Phaeocystis_antarctica.AAC.1